MPADAAFPCHHAGGIQHIKPFRHGEIFALRFVGHVVEHHREREVIPQHAGGRDLGPFVVSSRLGKKHIIIDIGRRLRAVGGVGFLDIDA